MEDSLKLEELMCQWTSDFEEEQVKRKPPQIKVIEKKRPRSRHPNLRPQFSVKKKADFVSNSHFPPSIRDLCDADKARIAELIKELGRVTSQKDEIISKMKSEKEGFELHISNLSSEKQSLVDERLKLEEKLSKTETALNALQQQLSDQIAMLDRKPCYNTFPCICSETAKTAKIRSFTEQIDAELRKELELNRSVNMLDQCAKRRGSDVGPDIQNAHNRSFKVCSCCHNCPSPSAFCSHALGLSDKGRLSDSNCDCQKNVYTQDFSHFDVGAKRGGDCSRQILRGHVGSNSFTSRNDEARTNRPRNCSSPRIPCQANGTHPSCLYNYHKNPQIMRRTERQNDEHEDQQPYNSSSSCLVDCSTPAHVPKRMYNNDDIPGIHESKMKTVMRGEEDCNSSVLSDIQIDVKKVESVSSCHSADIDQRIAEIDARRSQSHRELLLKEKEVLERERRCLELLLEQREMKNSRKSSSVPNTHRSRVVRPQSAHSVHSIVIKPGLLNRCDSRASSQTPTSLCESVNIQLPETEEETTTMSPNNFARCDRYTRRPGRSPPSPPSSILDIVESMNGGDMHSDGDDEDDENRLLEDVFFVRLL